MHVCILLNKLLNVMKETILLRLNILVAIINIIGNHRLKGYKYKRFYIIYSVVRKILLSTLGL